MDKDGVWTGSFLSLILRHKAEEAGLTLGRSALLAHTEWSLARGRSAAPIFEFRWLVNLLSEIGQEQDSHSCRGRQLGSCLGVGISQEIAEICFLENVIQDRPSLKAHSHMRAGKIRIVDL
jgi:hypothetical protein